MPSLATLVATQIYRGFTDYFSEFQVFTLGARERFINADWLACQAKGKERIDLYLHKVLALKDRIDELADGDNLMEAAVWRIAKNEYSELIKPLSNSEIAETFFNSIYCKYFDHQNINPELLFVLPAADQFSRGIDPDGSIFNHYYAHNNLTRMLESILSDYDFGLKFEDLANNVRQMRSTILKELPATLIRNREAFAVIHKSIFYRSKAAYLIGKVISAEMTVPFVIPILQNEHGEIYVDTLMFDPDDLSVLFSYTRAYFKVDAPVPSEIVRFLKELMPWKPYSELYNSIGFNRHGKTEFYREYLHHVENSADQFVLAPGIKGMVMSVFTLPSFDRVFKVIKDRFDPPKNMSRQTVKEKYNLVSRHDRAGRMADTQEYSNLTFPRHRFSEELLDELKKVASSSLEIDEQTVLIKHLYVERKMIPLNIFFETATEEQTAQTIDEYGNAIKELAAANIFPGDMLYKNFGLTRHKRVVFYDYDEICPLTDCNFRFLPEPTTPEQEMAAEPWYSVAPNDIFPEEFPTFLLGNPKIRAIFRNNHSELFDPNWWKQLQQSLSDGQVMNVLPYHPSKRFKRTSH